MKLCFLQTHTVITRNKGSRFESSELEVYVEPTMVVYAYNPSSLRQEDHWEFQTSIGYKVSLGIVGTAEGNHWEVPQSVVYRSRAAVTPRVTRSFSECQDPRGL